MSEKLLIKNCRLFDAADGKQTSSVLIEDGVIAAVGADAGAGEILDAKGRLLAPGFIDVHIQGAGGADVLDGTEEALSAIAKTCARFGTTSFLATTVFKPGQSNKHLFVAAENTGRDLGGANLLGIHLEGPFISLLKKGMILPSCICEPSMDVIEEIEAITKDTLKMMTIAPELSGCLPIIKRIANSGVIAAIAHSNATYEEALAGFDAGISHATHLFNAMPSIHHRSPGALIAVFQTPKISAQIIPDGVHLHPAILKFAFDILGPQRTILITDGMQAIGLPEGKYVYNGLEYESKQGTARYKDGTLIGTTLSLNQLLGRFISFTKCPLDVTIKTVTENPAKLLGIWDKKGSIAVGKDADLVLFEPDFSVYATIVAGRIVYQV